MTLHGHDDDDDDDDEMMLIVIYPITSWHTTQLIPTKDPPRGGISGLGRRADPQP